MRPLFFCLSPLPNDQGLSLLLQGNWKTNTGIPQLEPIHQALAAYTGKRHLQVCVESDLQWGSTLAAFLHKINLEAQAVAFSIDFTELPIALQKLMHLAEAVPSQDSGNHKDKHTEIYRLGQWALQVGQDIQGMLTFIGDIALSLGRFLKGEHCFRTQDFWLVIQQCGAQSLPIVTLISFLVGVTLAFVGAIQLGAFGASIYVANLVGLAMVREMGAMMAGIILCGRIGAAYASQIGNMKLSEELDAFRTLGISPIDFVVLPRVLALFLMMPLLALYADFIGILGGLTIGMTMLDISLDQYILQTQKAITFTGFSTGIIKSTVFGALIAITGCFRGLQCGSNASAIGAAVTSAVVTGITCLVVSDSCFAFIFKILNI